MSITLVEDDDYTIMQRHNESLFYAFCSSSFEELEYPPPDRWEDAIEFHNIIAVENSAHSGCGICGRVLIQLVGHWDLLIDAIS